MGIPEGEKSKKKCWFRFGRFAEDTERQQNEEQVALDDAMAEIERLRALLGAAQSASQAR